MGTESMKNTITMLLDIDTYQQGFITASNTGSKDEKIICKKFVTQLCTGCLSLCPARES